MGIAVSTLELWTQAFSFWFLSSSQVLFFHLVVVSTSSRRFENISQEKHQRWHEARKAGMGFSMPKDSVLCSLHCCYPQKLWSWHTPLVRNLCVNLLRLCISTQMCPQWFSISFLHLWVCYSMSLNIYLPSGWWLILLEIRRSHEKVGTVLCQMKTFAWLVTTTLFIM